MPKAFAMTAPHSWRSSCSFFRAEIPLPASQALIASNLLSVIGDHHRVSVLISN